MFYVVHENDGEVNIYSEVKDILFYSDYIHLNPVIKIYEYKQGTLKVYKENTDKLVHTYDLSKNKGEGK